MPDLNLSGVAVEAMRLQNAYALAIDARDWELFRTVFTPDVRADYPHGVFEGVEDWLGNFIPFHDTCAWTVHEITNHVVGSDGRGVWGTCYGWIRWTMKDNARLHQPGGGAVPRPAARGRGNLADRPAHATAAVVPAGRAGPGRVTPWSSPCSTWPTGRSGVI